MKKLREWLKVRQNAMMLMNAFFAAAVGMFGASAIVAPYSWWTIIHAFIAGFYAALLGANHFLERAHKLNAKLIKIADEQNEMLNEMGQMKVKEIAAQVASQMRGEAVSIVPPPAPPTKH